MTKNNKEKTIINSLAGVMAVITILAIFAVVILRQTAAQEEKDQKIQNATEYYKSTTKAKPGSLASKAQMVQQYNDKHAKKK